MSTIKKQKNMKALKIIAVLLLVINSYSQVTVEVPLGTDEYPNGAYLKDTDGVLTKYIGTWEGVLNNKKYTFVFQLFPQHYIDYPDGSYEYKDDVQVKFKVVDLSTNTVLYDGLSITNYDDYLIYCASRPYRGIFTCWYRDTPANCENSLSFALKNIPGSINQLKYCNFEYDEWYRPTGCPYTYQTDIPHFLPMEEFILTKL